MMKWNEPMDFDFNKKWTELPEEEWANWIKKIMYIEDKAQKTIAKKYNLDIALIREAVHLNSQDEWEATDKNIPDNEWIDAVMSVFEDELKESGYITENVD
jgi:hypothetical protein